MVTFIFLQYTFALVVSEQLFQYLQIHLSLDLVIKHESKLIKLNSNSSSNPSLYSFIISQMCKSSLNCKTGMRKFNRILSLTVTTSMLLW